MLPPSVGQAGAALGTAAGQDLPAVGGSHTLAEAMDLGAMTLLGLIGTNHAGTPPVLYWLAPQAPPPQRSGDRTAVDKKNAHLGKRIRDYTAKPAFLSTEFLRKIQKFSQLEKKHKMLCFSPGGKPFFILFYFLFFHFVLLVPFLVIHINKRICVDFKKALV